MSTQTQQVPVSPKALGMLFGFTHGVFRQNTAGVTHEDSLRQPQPSGNCINWVGGHLVSSRQGLLALLGAAPTWTQAEQDFYKRGSAPVTAAAGAMAWERIAADMDASQEALLGALSKLTAEQLLAPLPPEKNPFKVDCFGENLAIFQFHESYHVGQLGVLRRLLGRPGAIK